MTSLADRIEWILRERKISQRELARRSGLKEPHVGLILKRLRANPNAGVENETLLSIAKGGAVSVAWLVAGEGTPDGTPAEPTPPTPPAKSGPRERASASRADVEVDGWFSDTLQELGTRRYSRAQVQAAKVFLMSGNPLLEEGGPRKIVLGALEAARELDLLGQEPSPDAILALLISKNAPPSGPEPGARAADSAREFTVEYLAKERKAALKGFTPKKRDR